MKKGSRHGDEAIMKMRESQLKNPTRYWLGKHHNEETKQKISLANKGKKRSEETKEKIKENAKINSNYGMKCKKHSEESKKKMSVSHLNNPKRYWLGKKHSDKTKLKISVNTKLVMKDPNIRMKISNSNKGKKRSDEFKKKMSLRVSGRNNPMYNIHRFGKNSPNYGKKFSEEHKQKLRENHADFSGEKGPMFGKHHSEETKKKISKQTKIAMNIPEMIQKMSLTRSGRKMSEKTKKKIKETWNTPEKKEFARQRRSEIILPKKDTSIEIKIQNFLKELNIDFFTHQYIKEIKHGYQCDILIPSKNLVIECDGNYWHHYPTGTEMDNIRTKELLEKGFKVLRLWEIDIKKMELNDFKEKLDAI